MGHSLEFVPALGKHLGVLLDVLGFDLHRVVPDLVLEVAGEVDQQGIERLVPMIVARRRGDVRREI